jgi:hypothetical protein
VAPLAINVVEAPGHIEGGADKVTVGVVLTTTEIVPVGLVAQPGTVAVTE